jgi:hypothetical protein
MLTLLMLSAFASHVQSRHAKSTQTFASFWVQFRAAVAKNDKEAVATMTRFPFPFGNEEITRAEFIEKYDSIFGRKAQRCFAKAKPVNDYQAYLDAVKITKEASLPPPQEQQDTGGYHVFCAGRIYLFRILRGRV